MRRSLALLVITALAVSGCGGSPEGSTGYATDGTFTIAIPEDRGPFDPYHINLTGYAGLAYDSLVYLRPGGKFVSGLAKEWSADARSATFTLRPGVTCSDGTPLTASQVAAAITYNADPKNQTQFYGVSVPTAPMTVTGDDATGTVRIAMTKEPFGFLLHTVGQLPIVCAKGLKNREVLKKGSDGTGPFVLTEYTPGQSFTFAVRKDYAWGPDGADTKAPGTPAKVVLKVVPNDATAANLLLSGELNLARIAGEDRLRLDAQGLKKVGVAGPGAWLRFNQLGERPTTDKRLRQALMHALDLDQVIKVSTGGQGKASTGLVAMNPNPCTEDTIAGRLPGHDAAAAKALLDQAGWTAGADGTRSKDGKPLTLDLHYVSAFSPFEKPTAELIAGQLKAAGVTVKLSPDTIVAFGKQMYETSDWDLYLVTGGFYLPSQAVKFVSGPFPPKGTNGSGIANKEYDALVTKAQTMVPPQACEYWKQAEQALWREVNIAPISDRPNGYYLSKAEADLFGFELPIPTSIRVRP
jgi:peptide/nickel transport system substrate-binding protein